MILTQKLTALGFAFHDGAKRDEELSPDQRSQAVKYIHNLKYCCSLLTIFIYYNKINRDSPHIIEFLSYVFNFQGVVCGPLVYYQDYINFIDGNNILKKKVSLFV